MTRAEMLRVVKAIPEKYLPHIESRRTFRALKTSGKMHRNTPMYALQSASEKSIGRRVTPSGFFHSQILHALAKGMKWAEAEERFGKQQLKTASADFVRQFYPAILLENL